MIRYELLAVIIIFICKTMINYDILLPFEAVLAQKGRKLWYNKSIKWSFP